MKESIKAWKLSSAGHHSMVPTSIQILNQSINNNNCKRILPWPSRAAILHRRFLVYLMAILSQTLQDCVLYASSRLVPVIWTDLVAEANLELLILLALLSKCWDYIWHGTWPTVVCYSLMHTSRSSCQLRFKDSIALLRTYQMILDPGVAVHKRSHSKAQGLQIRG